MSNCGLAVRKIHERARSATVYGQQMAQRKPKRRAAIQDHAFKIQIGNLSLQSPKAQYITDFERPNQPVLILVGPPRRANWHPISVGWPEAPDRPSGYLPTDLVKARVRGQHASPAA